MVPLSPRLVGPTLLAALAVGCAFQFLAAEPYEETFSSAGYALIRIAGVEGDMQLRGMPGTSWVKARGTSEAVGATDARARANLDHARLRARNGEGGALILAFDPPGHMLGLVDLKLDGLTEVPAELGLTVDVNEGDLMVSDLNGPLVLETDNGDVTVSASGSIDITAAGNAEVSVGEINGRRIDVRTEGGSIILALPEQDFEIFCRAEGGDVTVDELGFDGVSVDQLNDGTVVVTNGSPTAPGAKTVDLRSSGDDIRIQHIVVE